jgi:hypothetical protein
VLDGQQTPAVGMTGDACDFDALTAEGIGYIDVLCAEVSDSVAEMADAIDRETLNHGARR